MDDILRKGDSEPMMRQQGILTLSVHYLYFDINSLQRCQGQNRLDFALSVKQEGLAEEVTSVPLDVPPTVCFHSFKVLFISIIGCHCRCWCRRVARYQTSKPHSGIFIYTQFKMLLDMILVFRIKWTPCQMWEAEGHIALWCCLLWGSSQTSKHDGPATTDAFGNRTWSYRRCRSVRNQYSKLLQHLL